MNYYEAKFAREKKAKPTEWQIISNPGSQYCRLVHIGDRRRK